MAQPRDSRTALLEAAWRQRLQFFAFAFVIITMIVQAVTAPMIAQELAYALERGNQTFERSRRLVRDLSFLFEHQAAELRGLVLTDDPRYLESYRAALLEEERTFEQLEQIVPRIGPVAMAQLERVRETAARWHVLNSQLVSGEITLEVYSRHLPRQTALNDSTQAAAALLTQEIDRVARAYIAEVGETVRRQLMLSVVLEVLALISAGLVGWFWWRQTTLSRQLARSAVEERRLRAESERRRDELRRITESRNRLMRGFSHDVKNPLGAADGYLQLLEDGILGELSSRQAEGVRNARRSIAAALDLIQDLIGLARAETGSIEVKQGPLDLKSVMMDAAEEYRAQAEAAGLELRVEYPDGLPTIESDAHRMRQIIGNLLSNAVKYTEKGGVVLRVRSVEGGEAPGPGRWIAIDVSDTGPGIPEDEIGLLFREFTRLSSAAGKGGTGVGLAISRRLAHALGGDISVESEPGRGSTFTLWLPVVADVAERAQAAD